MRTTFVGVLLICVLSLNLVPAAGQGAIRVLVNGEELAFDVPPVEVGGRLLVPLRGVFERLGATVLWEPSTQRITAATASKTIELVMGRREAAVDGRMVLLDTPPMVVGGRTMVPLRFVSEALGAYVQWQATARTVLITLATAEPAPPGYRPRPTPLPTPVVVTPAPIVTPSPRVTEGVLVAIALTTTPPRIHVNVGAVIYIFAITPETAISRFDAGTGAGGSAALAALRVGDQVRVEAVGASNDAASVRASFRLLRGRVDVLTHTAIALQDGQVVRINSDAAVTINGAPVPLGDAPARVRRGDEVAVRMNPTSNEAWELAVTSLISGTPTAAPTATPAGTPSARTVTYVSRTDAPLIEAAPGTSHPTEVLFVGRDATGRFRSVVSFNVALPSGATVRRATLRLFMYGHRSGGTDFYTVFPVTRNWSEGTATWNLLAGSYATLRPAGPVTIAGGATRIFVEWDVTGIVRAWTTGSMPNYGLLIRNMEMGANLVYFGHGEDVLANRPRLIVEFTAP
ncbi:MAG: stalk domain-containing protein [bacterium]|nr:stalk domain-containing protein [bacterium]